MAAAAAYSISISPFSSFAALLPPLILWLVAALAATLAGSLVALQFLVGADCFIPLFQQARRPALV